jgi:hypothetical protein
VEESVTVREQASTPEQLHIFLSYRRGDSAAVRAVEARLGSLPDGLWKDRVLDSGQGRWDEILERIRNCCALVVAVSPAMLESAGVAAELDYARRLGKPVVPVMVAPVPVGSLPEDIAGQLIDCTTDGPAGTVQLAGALAAVRPLPLPDPLPEPPPVPVAYLDGPSHA